MHRLHALIPVFALLLSGALHAQSTNASVTGYVTDQTKAAIADAKVIVINTGTNMRREALADRVGNYSVSNLPPGPYRVEVEKPGFRTVVKSDVVLHVQESVAINFEMTVGSASEVVTVEGGAPIVNTQDASVSTVVDRQFVENMPLNGRSFQALIQLTPGVTAMTGASGASTGEFSVNGQRTETNYYTVDGVAANTVAGDLNRAGGGTPQTSAMGTTQPLVSLDALQEFRISTSSYSSEYGRGPGGQISFQTRSGTNIWHGSAFDYFRNGALDANNWFNNHNNLPRPAERQNDFGGTLGGPFMIPGLYNGKDRTFFFFSYEGLRVTVPRAAITKNVPALSLRQSAPPAMQPILNAFPLPNGSDQGNGMALYTGSYSAPSTLDSYSVRVDHTFGEKMTVFGRYANTPSESETRSSANLANITTNSFGTETATVGATNPFSPRLVNEFRFNYTDSYYRLVYSADDFGGATPVTPEQFAPGITIPRGYNLQANLGFGTMPYVLLGQFYIPQHQWNITDSMTTTAGAHTLKYGIDYRKLVTTQNANSLVNSYRYNSAAAVLANAGNSSSVQSYGPGSVGLFTNFSAFVQDEWKVTSRLHLSLGLRWDLNPAPKAAEDPQPYNLDQIDNLATAKLAPAGTPMYKTDYTGFGPRLGAAYQLGSSSDYQTVLRGGFGLFYDVGSYGTLYGLFGGIGIGSRAVYNGAQFPFTVAQQTLPAPSVAAPYTQTVMAADPHLRLPYTLQWNAAIQQGLGRDQSLTVSYVGASGRRLLYNAGYNLVGINPNFGAGSFLYIVNGASSSDYHSMQTQFLRKMSHGLQVLASYTWSHSIDDLSSNQTYSAVLIRGNSNFDVRHSFNAAVSYAFPSNYSNKITESLLGNWYADLRESARSSLPVDVYYGYSFLQDGLSVRTRPDLRPGVPLYIGDPTAPGERLINYDAFAPPSGAGNAPRNSLRGFSMWQTDLAVRREFPIRERVKLQFRAEAFNLFNHPIFGTIDNSVSDGRALFGRATGTLNNSLGGLNSLYQQGGPRSLQLALKLVF